MNADSCMRWGLPGLLLLLVTACVVASEPLPTDVLIFVDFSGSIGDQSQASFEDDIRSQILPALGAGDRIMVAPIDDSTLTGFHTLVDTSFPPPLEFNGWSDNVLSHKVESDKLEAVVDGVRNEVNERVGEIFDTGFVSNRTDIFSSLLLAQKVFHNRQTRKVLILMSDMIVDYPPYRFDKMKWDSGKRDNLLSDLDEKGLIADLSGVCIYVTGATGSSAEQMVMIGRFWEEYFKRSGANMDPSRYSHVLLHWPPSEAHCSQAPPVVASSDGEGTSAQVALQRPSAE